MKTNLWVMAVYLDAARASRS